MAVVRTREEWAAYLTRGAEALGLTLDLDDYGAEATRATLCNGEKTWTWINQDWFKVAVMVRDALTLYAAGKGVDLP